MLVLKEKNLLARLELGNTTSVEVLNSKPPFNVGFYASRPNCSFSPKLSNPIFGRAVLPLLSTCSFPRHYSLFSSSSSASEVSVSDSGGGGNDWLDRAKDLWHSAVDAAAYAGQKAKEASAELSPRFEQLPDSHPYLKEMVVLVSLAFTGTVGLVCYASASEEVSQVRIARPDRFTIRESRRGRSSVREELLGHFGRTHPLSRYVHGVYANE